MKLIDNISHNYVKFYIVVATDVLPPFKIPREWRVKEENLFSFVLEQEEIPETKFYIEAEFGLDWTEEFSKQISPLKYGLKLIDWLYQNTDKNQNFKNKNIKYARIENNID